MAWTVEQKRAANAKWQKENRAKATAYTVKWTAKNRERVLAQRAEYRKRNRERLRKEHADAYHANPKVHLIYCQNRRARKRASGGKLSPGLQAKLFVLQKGKCPCCRLPLGDDYHMDHKVPIRLGGEHADSNIQLMRKSCNLSKNAKHPVEFMQSRGFLL